LNTNGVDVDNEGGSVVDEANDKAVTVVVVDIGGNAKLKAKFVGVATVATDGGGE
jgi:hypothetical protein